VGAFRFAEAALCRSHHPQPRPSSSRGDSSIQPLRFTMTTVLGLAHKSNQDLWQKVIFHEFSES
jgi:hypothetical protein